MCMTELCHPTAYLLFTHFSSLSLSPSLSHSLSLSLSLSLCVCVCLSLFICNSLTPSLSLSRSVCVFLFSFSLSVTLPHSTLLIFTSDCFPLSSLSTSTSIDFRIQIESEKLFCFALRAFTEKSYNKAINLLKHAINLSPNDLKVCPL